MSNERRRVLGRVGVLVLGCIAFLGGAAQAADCLTASGKTACGFHCLASDGEVRCSQTPDGVCSMSSGVIACWDPPSILRRAFGDQFPRPSCLSTDGQTACGYSCETSDAHVLCAQTPFGKCQASDGKLVCWDPPAVIVLTRRERTPVAECIASTGKIACGYHCLSHDGSLRCAQTPDGGCSVQQGNLVCWDPPLDTYNVAFDPAAELSCIDAEDGRSCGYRCIATSTHSACGSTRADSCRVQPDGITCKPPN